MLKLFWRNVRIRFTEWCRRREEYQGDRLLQKLEELNQ